MLHSRPPDAFLARLFHIRLACHPTCEEIYWHRIDATAHCADSPVPFEPRSGRGDKTVPYWSARYCYTPLDQVCDVETETEHGDLMEDDAVLATIDHLARLGNLPRTASTANTKHQAPRPAPANAVRQLAIDEGRGKAAPDDPRRRDPAIWRRLLLELGFD